MLEPARFRGEACEERAQLRGGLAQAKLDVAEFVAGTRELGRQRLQRRNSTLRERREAGGSLPLVGCKSVGSLGRPGDELLEVAKLRTLVAQLRLGARLELRRVLDERAQLRETLLSARRAFHELLVAASRAGELAPGRAHPGAQLGRFCERVEHVELERGPREPPLLELAGHRDRLLGRRRDVLARGGAAPGVGARPAVLEDAPREDEPALVLGTELLQGLARAVDLRLHVRLVARRADHRGLGTRAEQQADRLREDRLAGAGLAGDRVQAGCEIELGAPDQDEVLDAQPVEHGPIVA